MRIMDVISSRARIVTTAGVAFIGNLLHNAGFKKSCKGLKAEALHPQAVISNADVLTAQIANMCRGVVNYEGIHEYDNDETFYKDALGIEHIPSPETLRQRLDEIAAGRASGMEWRNDIREMNVRLLLNNQAQFTALPNGMVPVDGDVTPFDESGSNKEGVAWTYKKFPGYAPLNLYGGLEGNFVNTDFREGNKHSQCEGTEQVLIETIDIMNRLVPDRPLLFRLDSGNDAVIHLGVIMDRGHFFIIKRNLRQESSDGWLAKAEAGAPIHETPREGKDIYIGSDWKTISYVDMENHSRERTARIVYEVIRRTIDKKGQTLLIPDVEVHTWWDNTGLPEKDVIELYHQHATMEQFHSEIKTDMSMEKLPSGKFATNMLINDLSMIAYNILRMIGTVMNQDPDLPIRNPAFRRRLLTVIINMIHVPAYIKTSGRSLIIDVGRSNVWAKTFIRVYQHTRSANMGKSAA